MKSSEIRFQYMRDKDITELLGITQQTLNNKVYRGDNLPRFTKPPGTRTRLWKKEDVNKWLAQKIDYV